MRQPRQSISEMDKLGRYSTGLEKEGTRVGLYHYEFSTDSNLELMLYKLDIVGDTSGLTGECYSEPGEMGGVP